MIFDFRRYVHNVPALEINNEMVEVTQAYRYLGITLDNKLSWNEHVNSVVKKANQRLYFLRKLRSFEVDPNIMITFYRATIESVITFGISCYGGNISKQQQQRLDRVIRKAAKVVNSSLPSFTELYNTNVLKTAKKIMADNKHPLYSEYQTSVRSKRLISKKARTNRYNNSFIPSSVRLMQSVSSLRY